MKYLRASTSSIKHICAFYRGDLVCLASYLDDGVEVDLADSTRRSLLFHAVNYGQIGAVQLLLERYDLCFDILKYRKLHQLLFISIFLERIVLNTNLLLMTEIF